MTSDLSPTGRTPPTVTTSDREARIDAAIKALTVAGKVRLLTGAALFELRAEPAIGLDAMRLSDGPTGVRGPQFAGGRVSCLLPNATLLAQHWDTDVAHEVGAVLGEEAVDQDVHVVLGPTINLHRTPLGGRVFEAFSEDPLLTGILAGSYVRGLQEHGVAATPKHFVANESELNRTTVDSVVDDATLREVYLLPFEMVVADAHPWSVMAAYNRINGITATEHAPLVEGVLKGEWNYDGLVMSDWYATSSTAASANGGLDLVMPGPGGPWEDNLVGAVNRGEVDEKTLDEHVRRLLRLADRVGVFGTEGERPAGGPAPDSTRRRDQLRRLAAGGMTVLTNGVVGGRTTLPLVGTESVAVIGRHGIETVTQGGGSAQVRPPHGISVADGFREALGDDRVRVVDGVEVRQRPAAPRVDTLRDPTTGQPGIRVTARDESGAVLESRHLDHTEIVLGFGGWTEGAATVELSATAELLETADMEVGVRGIGDWTVETGALREHVRTEAGHEDPGEGIINPPAWTTVTEVRPGQTITATLNHPTALSMVGLALRPAPKSPAEAIAPAAAAREVDVAVVVVGLTQEQETESQDKTTLALPGEQDAMVAAVAAAAPRTVVVVNAATPVLMPWLEQVDAVVWAGLPGQEAGAAVAAALLGEIEPAGRLVTTFPAHDGQGPAWSTVPVDGRLPYSEGTAVGYRGWDRPGLPRPRFWFGHGLGYTTWEYGTAELSESDQLVRSVTVEVTNSGPRPGKEVVQVYLRPDDGADPVRLVGWATAQVRPGESTRVRVPCDARVQRTWDSTEHRWRPLTSGTVLIGRSLDDVRATLHRDRSGG